MNTLRQRIAALDIDCSVALVLQTIARHADHDGNASISDKEIAAELRLKVQFVTEAIKLAIAGGYIARVQGGFRLNVPDLPVKPDETPMPQDVRQAISNIRRWYFDKVR